MAREQVVDRQTIETTRLREEYVDALLAIAGAKPRLELAPASKTRLVGSPAASLGILIAACWLITVAFPLKAAPAVVADAHGVTVEMGGATLRRRTPVVSPEAARKQGVEGTVTVQVKIDARGNVADAQVLSGPDELRNPVLQSVLNWPFGREVAGSTQQLSIELRLPAEATKPTRPLETTPAPGPPAQAARQPEAGGLGLTIAPKEVLQQMLPNAGRSALPLSQQIL